MPKSISTDTKNLLELNSSATEINKLIKLAIDGQISINEIATLAGVSRMTITNWINGHPVRDKNLHKLRNALIQKGLLMAPNDNKRFSIPSIRSEIENKMLDQKKKLAEERARIGELKAQALREEKERERINTIFMNTYGREILEDAINGFTSISIYEENPTTIDLEAEGNKRGFLVTDNGYTYFDDLSEEYQKKYRNKLFKTCKFKIGELDEQAQNKLRRTITEKLLKIRSSLNLNYILVQKFPDLEKLDHILPHNKRDFSEEPLEDLINLSTEITLIPMYVGEKKISEIQNEIYELAEIIAKYEDDESLIEKIFNWVAPEEHHESIKDCVTAKFLDWIGDKFGRQLISNLFERIEKNDLSGKKKLVVKIKKKNISNEYTDDDDLEFYEIANVDFPFPLTVFTSMLELLGYGISITNSNPEKADDHDEIEIRWAN